jgi:hypothetical protein
MEEAVQRREAEPEAQMTLRLDRRRVRQSYLLAGVSSPEVALPDALRSQSERRL